MTTSNDDLELEFLRTKGPIQLLPPSQQAKPFKEKFLKNYWRLKNAIVKWTELEDELERLCRLYQLRGALQGAVLLFCSGVTMASIKGYIPKEAGVISILSGRGLSLGIERRASKGIKSLKDSLSYELERNRNSAEILEELCPFMNTPLEAGLWVREKLITSEQFNNEFQK